MQILIPTRRRTKSFLPWLYGPSWTGTMLPSSALILCQQVFPFLSSYHISLEQIIIIHSTQLGNIVQEKNPSMQSIIFSILILPFWCKVICVCLVIWRRVRKSFQTWVIQATILHLLLIFLSFELSWNNYSMCNNNQMRLLNRHSKFSLSLALILIDKFTCSNS